MPKIVTKKLKSKPYAQCCVNIINDKAIELVSYETVAATIDADGWLTISCLCSNTTRTHVSKFLEEYCPNVPYKMARRIYEKGMSVNVDTGDIRPVNG